MDHRWWTQIGTLSAKQFTKELKENGKSCIFITVVKCARSQVRPFHEDDEAAHAHVTELMRKL